MNQTLERVLRVLNFRNLGESTSPTEMAKLAGVSRTTIYNQKDDIQEYLKTAQEPSQADLDTIDRKLVKSYVLIALTSASSKQHFLQVMGAIAGYVLRNDTDMINNIQTPKKIVRVGFEYMRLVTQVESRKGANGTPVHSQNGAARYLLTELNNSSLVKDLFSRSNSYRTDAYSKIWKLKDKAEQLNKKIIDLTIGLVEEYNEPESKLTLFPLHIGDSLCSGKSVNLGVIDASRVQEHFLIGIPDLAKLSMRSFIQIMSIAVPATANCIIVPLKNLAKVDPNKGRIYNIFSRLRSSERKALGYYNYDISGGLQIISFNILTQYPLYHYKTFDDLHAAYPLIFTYGVDPSAKNALREQISADLGKSVDDVKALLTAYSNGSQKKVGNSAKLKAFFEESDRLRREVVATIANYKPELLKSAVEQSKNDFPEDTDWQSIEKEGNGQEARDKASVFFFIWTYFEKQIRDAMLSVVDDGIPVHDAVYSKHKLPFKAFEDAIYEQTDFQVKISN